MDDDTPKYESFTETEQDSGSTIRPNRDAMNGKRSPLPMGGKDNVPFDSVTTSSHKETFNVYGRKLNDEEPKRGDLLVNRYQVLDELGRGGMGVVFRCFDTIAGVEVAVKALPQLLSNNKSEMEEVKDNFQLVHGLVHTNIAVLTTLERDPANGAYYLVMELVWGEELRHWLRERWRETGSTLPLDEALPILRQVAEALDYAHSRRIIHRDVKPANVMVCKDGLVKVMDFGLAAQVRTSLARVSHQVVSTSGTRAYMSPEQWLGEPQGTAADQYALGVMAYEMLSGHLPFEAVDTELMRLAVLNEDVRPIKGVPETANGALKRALSKKPADRFPSCGDFVKALAGEKPLSVSPSTSEPRRPEMIRMDSRKLMQEVYLLQVEMEKKRKLVEEANYERGQTFGEHLDEFSRNYTSAVRVMADAANPERFRLAHDWYGTARAEVEWLTRNEQLRRKIRGLLPKVEDERDKAKNEDAELLAKAEFNSANEQLVNAEKAFENGEFADALELLGKAKESFKHAFDTIIWKHLNAAETALAQGHWGDARIEAKNVLKLSPYHASAGQLVSNADAGEKKETVAALLTTAQNAYDAKDWKKAQGTVDEILAMGEEYVPVEYEAARKLKDNTVKNDKVAAFLWTTLLCALPLLGIIILFFSQEIRTPVIPAWITFLWTIIIVGMILFFCKKDGRTHETRTPVTMTIEEDDGTKKLIFEGGVSIKIIQVKAGKFQMGSTVGELGREKNETLHEVTLTQDYWLGETEVTQGQWKAVMCDNPSLFESGDEYPVDNVSWEDAMKFCKKLNKSSKDILPPGYEFSLPTEAQWEYACRAGTKTSLNSGLDITAKYRCPNLDAVGWYCENTSGSTHPVGKKMPNAWGFYDMHGNVYEWCSDWYGDYSGDASDPKGPADGSCRVRRGGSWYSHARYCRAAERDGGCPSYRRNYLGFRLALVPVQ